MSISINPRTVSWVQISGVAYGVDLGSFYLDAYEFVLPSGDNGEALEIVHGGGDSGICSTGFSFRIRGEQEWVSGPLTAIEAVRHGSRPA